MKLLVIRHGVAEDRDSFAASGQPDTQRPLTDDGRKRMRGAARGLHRVVPKLTVLASSRLVRAAQTAEIVSKAYGGMDVVTLEELSPERRPDELLGWLLTGRNDSFVEMKKGGAVLLEFDDPPSGGNAVLAWAIPPRQLRWLGEDA